MEEDRVLESDILVVGGGIAGAFAAIKAREQGVEVLLVDKSFFGRSGCSAVASGVFKMYMPDDGIEVWTKKWGGPFVNKRLLVRSALLSHELVLFMDKWGVKWIKEEGKIVRCPSPGSLSPHNAMMEKGGPQMMMALRGEVLRRGVKVINRVMVTDLLTSDGRLPTEGKVVGAMGFDIRSGQIYIFKARATIMCAGPYRFPYAEPGRGFSCMPRDLSGDGVAMMLRAGAHLGNMGLGAGGLGIKELGCAPGLEMLLGLGGKLVNGHWDYFMERYDPVMKDRAGRGILSNTVLKEISSGRGPVYMDIRHFNHDQIRLLKMVVPIIISTWESAGYDLKKDIVPYDVSPAATSGVNGAGARINERAETSIPGLYAAGNNSDGANSSMGQALPGSAVVGYWSGENAPVYAKREGKPEINEEQVKALKEKIFTPLSLKEGITFNQIHEKLESLLLEDVGYILNGQKMEKALQNLEKIIQEDMSKIFAPNPHELAKVIGLCNFAQALDVVLRVLIHRAESRGSILREDFPEIDNENWLKWTIAKKEGDESIRLWNEPIPDSPDFGPVERKKIIHPFFRN